MPQFLFLVIIIRIITCYNDFYLKAVRQHEDCYFILLILEMPEGTEGSLQGIILFITDSAV